MRLQQGMAATYHPCPLWVALMTKSNAFVMKMATANGYFMGATNDVATTCNLHDLADAAGKIPKKMKAPRGSKAMIGKNTTLRCAGKTLHVITPFCDTPIPCAGGKKWEADIDAKSLANILHLQAARHKKSQEVTLEMKEAGSLNLTIEQFHITLKLAEE